MDMSIPDLAALSGVHENTLLDIMAGIREPDISTLCRIADALGVCVRELCPDEEQYTLPVEKVDSKRSYLSVHSPPTMPQWLPWPAISSTSTKIFAATMRFHTPALLFKNLLKCLFKKDENERNCNRR